MEPTADDVAVARIVTSEFSREEVEVVLDTIRPYLKRDGGNIELLAVEGDNVRVRLHGACTNCPSASLTLRHSVERALRAELPGFGELLEDTAPSSERTAKRWWNRIRMS